MEGNYGNGTAYESPTMYRDLMFDPVAGVGLSDAEAEAIVFDAIPLEYSDLVEIVEQEPLRISAEAGSVRQAYNG